MSTITLTPIQIPRFFQPKLENMLRTKRTTYFLGTKIKKNKRFFSKSLTQFQHMFFQKEKL